MIPTKKLLGFIAVVVLAAPAVLAEEVIVPLHATPSCAEGEAAFTAPRRIIVVETVTETMFSEHVAMPFVGAAPFTAGKALPRPFVGERPAISVTARAYFGERPTPQPPVDATSVQIPVEPEKR
ncbi:MAG: hypothetical protein WC538_01555 [Thermoanaerobaculia bacterium]